MGHQSMGKVSQTRTVVAMIALSMLAGCVAKPDVKLTNTVYRGEFGKARVYMAEKVARQPPPKAGAKSKHYDRDYQLNRLRLLMIALADGYPRSVENLAQEVFDLYRTQGINEDRTVASVVINEDLKVWKGEPFEQAMGLHYVGLYYAMQRQWGNMRAATETSLFQLRDFGEDDQGNEYDAVTLAKRAAEDDQVLEDYEPRDSNFTLGYLLNGVANMQLGRNEEADRRFGQVLRINPELRPLVDQIRQREGNVLLVVDYGRGPQKIGTGPDQSVAKFVAKTPSDPAPLMVSVNGEAESQIAALDLNRIATDLMWNNLEDVRVAKSHIGTALVGAGAGVAAYGADNRSTDMLIAGPAIIAAGAAVKASAHADTRYCEIMPQRTYVAMAEVNSPDDELVLQVEGKPQTRLVVDGLRTSGRNDLKIAYYRLVSDARRAPTWATKTRTLYANPYEPDAGTDCLPYIMGGDCACPPSAAMLRKYQAAGYLKHMTLARLEDLYRAEGLYWNVDSGNDPGLHVLEGGKSLVAPAPGTEGYARIFRQNHAPYRPKSKELRVVVEQMNAAAAQVAQASP